MRPRYLPKLVSKSTQPVSPGFGVQPQGSEAKRGPDWQATHRTASPAGLATPDGHATRAETHAPQRLEDKPALEPAPGHVEHMLNPHPCLVSEPVYSQASQPNASPDFTQNEKLSMKTTTCVSIHRGMYGAHVKSSPFPWRLLAANGFENQLC